MAGPRGLGRGLDALIRQTSVEENAAEARRLSIDAIRVNPYQPRTVFDDESIAELTASIKSQGVLQPVLVRELGADGAFELVAGERRLRAARLAGLAHIPAIVRKLTDEQTLIIALIENLQRENLNPVDEAKGMARLREMLGLSQEDIATRLGKSRAGVANALRLLQLPGDILDDLAKGTISAGHARAALALPDAAAQRELRDRIAGGGLSVREAEALAAAYKQNGAFPETAEPIASPAPASKAPRRKPAERPHDERLAPFQEKISGALGATVEIKGVLERGRIVIRFKGEDALMDLMDKIAGDRT